MEGHDQNWPEAVDPIEDPVGRITTRSRPKRTILRALALGGFVAALGGWISLEGTGLDSICTSWTG